jgi:hypothetical protein
VKTQLIRLLLVLMLGWGAHALALPDQTELSLGLSLQSRQAIAQSQGGIAGPACIACRQACSDAMLTCKRSACQNNGGTDARPERMASAHA